jgi:hypothetical protein
MVDVVNKNIPRRGEIHPQENYIKLDRTMAQSKIEECLFHEVLHEINDQLRLELSEEDICRISYAFYGFLADNGLLKE